MIRLNVGGGSHRVPGFLNVDAHDDTAEIKCDMRTLPYADNEVDEIRSYHSLEHLDFHQGVLAVAEWHRCLKPGGRLVVETVDALELYKAFVAGSENERVSLYPLIHGMNWVPGGQHLFIYTETQLGWTFSTHGFVNVKRLPALRYIGLENVCLAIEGYKVK